MTGYLSRKCRFLCFLSSRSESCLKWKTWSNPWSKL